MPEEMLGQVLLLMVIAFIWGFLFSLVFFVPHRPFPISDRADVCPVCNRVVDEDPRIWTIPPFDKSRPVHWHCWNTYNPDRHEHG